MKNNLFGLLVLMLLSSQSLQFASCNKCEGGNKKIGETTLFKDAQSFISQFVGKKVIFKDSLGNEMTFRDTSGLVKNNEELPTEVICENTWPNPALVSYIGYESWSVGLKSDSFLIQQTCVIITRVAFQDTSLIYDALRFTFLSKPNSFQELRVDAEISKRGVSTRPDFNRDNLTIIADTLLNQKRFSNLIKINGQESATYLNVVAGFLDTKKGLVAFKLKSGKLWVFDRIE